MGNPFLLNLHFQRPKEQEWCLLSRLLGDEFLKYTFIQLGRLQVSLLGSLKAYQV